MFIMISVSFLGTACLSCSSSRDDLHCEAVQVEGGYGYVVLHGADTLIVQPYMPAVGGRKPFTTQDDALAVGKLVCRKIAGGQSPAVSKEEVGSCLRR